MSEEINSDNSDITSTEEINSDNSDIAAADGEESDDTFPSPYTDDLYCEEVLSLNSPPLLVQLMKEDSRWNVATYHLRREYGNVRVREGLWILTTLACSTRAWIYQRKAVKTLKRIWRKKVERNSNELKGMDRFRFIVPDCYQFTIPVDSVGSTLWL